MGVTVLMAHPPKACILIFVHVYSTTQTWVLCQELGQLKNPLKLVLPFNNHLNPITCIRKNILHSKEKAMRDG